MGKFSISQLMNNASKSEAAPEKANFKIEMIPVEKIVPSDMNKYTVANIEDLKASIEMIGLQQNLLVRAHDNGMYELISGHRRFKALQELYTEGNTNFATVPCKIIKSVDDIQAELQLLFGNSTVRQMSDWERTYQAKRIKELLMALKKSGYKFQGRMRQIVADLLDVSPAQVGRMESITENLSPEFQEEFKAGNIGPTAAYQYSRLPKERQVLEYTEYQETGAAKVKDIEKKRDDIKPRAETAPPEESEPVPPVPPADSQPEIPEKVENSVETPQQQETPPLSAAAETDSVRLDTIQITNFERLTESQEALAEFLKTVWSGKIQFDNLFCKGGCVDDDNFSCPDETGCIIKWLNKPCEECL